MSDNNGLKIDINIVPKFLDNALTPVAKEAGETLSDLVNLARSPLIKARAVRDMKLKIFLEDMDKELRRIPEDKIQEPPLSIVGPTLEDLFKYYLEEDHVVEAFKKLIASAMNKDKASDVHPMIAAIIKQISPQDAKVFKNIVMQSGCYLFSTRISCERDGVSYGGMVCFWDDLIKPEDGNIYEQGTDSLYNLKLLHLIKRNDYQLDEDEQKTTVCDAFTKKRDDYINHVKTMLPEWKITCDTDYFQLWTLDYFGSSLCRILDLPDLSVISYGNCRYYE